MDFALLTGDSNLLADAYRRSHEELVIMNGVKADGIRADGAFGMWAQRTVRGATNGIKLDLDDVGELGRLWNSAKLTNFASSLFTASNVNAGNLVGNRMFYTNDYMNEAYGVYEFTKRANFDFFLHHDEAYVDR
ncbi:hypothetical protein C0991_001393 [Blastosporella zonata]|nr:hypothetical protein C0991_001393 [Blastosporella zonata]